MKRFLIFASLFFGVVLGGSLIGQVQATTVTGTSSAPIAVTGTLAISGVDGGATSAAQATQLTALNLLTQPRTTTTVTKSDSTDTSSYCTKGLWVGTAGNVAVIYCGDSYDAGTAPILKNVPSGAFIPGCIAKVMSTNTGASDMVCFGGTG